MPLPGPPIKTCDPWRLITSGSTKSKRPRRCSPIKATGGRRSHGGNHAAAVLQSPSERPTPGPRPYQRNVHDPLKCRPMANSGQRRLRATSGHPPTPCCPANRCMPHLGCHGRQSRNETIGPFEPVTRKPAVWASASIGRFSARMVPVSSSTPCSRAESTMRSSRLRKNPRQGG